MTIRSNVTKYTWIWTKGNITYNATLYRNTFMVRNISYGSNIVLIIKNLTSDSQKNIIKSMHSIKNKPRVVYNG